MKSPVTRIVPKTLRNPLYSQYVSFLEKLRGFDKKQIGKSHEKTPVFEKTNFGYSLLRKPEKIFKQILNKSHKVEKCKRGHL